MSRKNVLITDYVHPILISGLHYLGYSTTYAPEMSRAEMEHVLQGYTGVVINTRCALDRAAIENAQSLRWIARLGSGLDIIDLVAAASQKVEVHSAPEGNAQAVAEHAAGMLLSLTNKLNSADQSVKNGDWEREIHRGSEIAGKTIGIIGYGNNGSAFARLWSGWNVKVLAYDKYVTGFGNQHIEETDLQSLLSMSDVISLHIPLTIETNEMVNEHFLASCKRGAILINTSRGKVVDMDALLSALQSGHLSGACLDVLPFEPPQKGPEDFQHTFRQLCALPQVILSPHVAGWTVESKQKIAASLISKISPFAFYR